MSTKFGYLSEIYSPEKGPATLAWLTESVQKFRGEFDTIAFRGSSGAPALALGMVLGLPTLHVRKDLGHAWSKVEGTFGERIAIVDDFVATGVTIRTIMDEIRIVTRRDFDMNEPRLTHLFLYNTSDTGRSTLHGIDYVRAAHPDFTLVERL